MPIVLGWLLCGVIAAGIGSHKGEGCSGFFVGCILGPVGILVAILSSGNKKACPFCKESIHKNALICPFCRTYLEDKNCCSNTSSSCIPSETSPERMTSRNYQTPSENKVIIADGNCKDNIENIDIHKDVITSADCSNIETIDDNKADNPIVQKEISANTILIICIPATVILLAFAMQTATNTNKPTPGIHNNHSSVQDVTSPSIVWKPSDKLPSFKIGGKDTSTVAIVVPKKTNVDDISAFVYELQNARKNGSFKLLIPPTTPGGIKGDYHIVIVYIMNNSNLATSESIHKFTYSGSNDSYNQIFGKGILGYYYFNSENGEESGCIGFSDSTFTSDNYKKLF